MNDSGKFRIHFNRYSAAPLVWSIAKVVSATQTVHDAFGGTRLRVVDEVQWELTVSSIEILGKMSTFFDPGKTTPDDEDGKPRAWLEVEGHLYVDEGHATITTYAHHVR